MRFHGVFIEGAAAKASSVLLCASLLSLVFLGLSSPAAAQGPVEFSDDFEAGLDTGVWDLEYLGGVQWIHKTEMGNGYIYSPPQVTINSANRYTDILTYRDDFGDFTFTWDMRYHTQSWHRDWRQTHFRSGAGPIPHGYTVTVGVWIPTIPDHYLAIRKLSPDGSDEVLHPSYVSYPWVLDQWYSFKLEASGNVFKLKVWPTGDPEPTDYVIEAEDPDSTYSSGRIGFGDYWLSETDVDNVRIGGICPENPDPSTQGYWHRQCLGVPASEGGIDPGRNGRGPESPTEPNFVPDLMDCAEATLGDLGFYDSTCEGMNADPPSDACQKAEKQLTALILNTCSGRVSNGCQVDVSAEGCSSTTVGDLLDEIAALIFTADCATAKACAAAVNEGDGLPDGAGGSILESSPLDREERRRERERQRTDVRRRFR